MANEKLEAAVQKLAHYAAITSDTVSRAHAAKLALKAAQDAQDFRQVAKLRRGIQSTTIHNKGTKNSVIEGFFDLCDEALKECKAHIT